MRYLLTISAELGLLLLGNTLLTAHSLSAQETSPSAIANAQLLTQQQPPNPTPSRETPPASPFTPFTPFPEGAPPPSPSQLPPKNGAGFESGAPTLTPRNYQRQLPNPSLNPSANPLNFPTKPSEVDIQQRQPITLDQALELALRNNTQLQSARLTLEQSQASLKVAQSDLFPAIDSEFSFSRDISAATRRANANVESDNPFFTPNEDASTNFNGNLQLVYNIYTGGERGARITRANKEVELNRLEVDRIAAETRFETTDRYYRLQDADAQVAIAQAAVEDTTQSLRDAQLLEQAGLGTRFDTLRAEGDLATAQQELTSAIARQRIARRSLVEFLNLGQHVELTAADEIREAGTWPLSLEQTIVQAYKNRAELEQQVVQREISEQDSVIALAGIRPQVDFVARYDFTDDFTDTASIQDGYSFAARMRWRLFDGGRAFAEARRAYRGMDLADTNFAQQRNQIRQQVEEGFFNLISSQENIASTRKNVERFEEALRLARLRFQAGVGTQTDVINAQRDLTDARGRFLQAIIGYNQSLNSLQRSVSNLPDNRLFQLH
jgi:OMF family outer membrane factor